MQNRALPVRLESPIKVEAEVKATLVGDNGKEAFVEGVKNIEFGRADQKYAPPFDN